MRGRGFTHESPGAIDWYTPPELFRALGIGGKTAFDLDPCAPPLPLAHWIPTIWRYTLGPSEREILYPPDGRVGGEIVVDDGLARDWSWARSVWLNPPYGDQTGRWVGKLAEHGRGIALTFTRTDTPWWQAAVDRADLVCFVAGRVEFIPGDPCFRRRSRSGAPSCLIAFGRECAEAVRRSRLGVCADLAGERALELAA